VELHLQKDAVIKFSTDAKDYLPVVFGRDVAEMMNYSPLIYALEQHDIAVTGEGVLDGQGPAGGWYPWAWNKLAKDATDKLGEWAQAGVPVSQRILGEGYHLRPNLFEPVRCRNVMIQGVTVLDSPMWVLHPLYCTNVIVRGVTVRSHGPNTDGCDPDSCTDVWIKDCVFQTGDDCIAVKSGRDEDGLKIAMPCQNVVIQGCRFADGHGGVTLGSETSGGLRNVFAEDCQFDSPNLDQALRFKTNPARGGFIEDIYLRRCAIQTAKFGIHITMRYGSSGTSTGDAIPCVRNIDIRDCTFANLTKKALFIEGLSEQDRVTDVSIINCTAEKSASPSTITNAVRVNLSGCKGM
jgi:polygalacturonase